MNDDVETPEALDRLRDHAIHLVAAADIGLIEPRDPAALRRWSRRRRWPLASLSGRDDALWRPPWQHARDALTDALAASGDDGDLARQIDDHDLFLLV